MLDSQNIGQTNQHVDQAAEDTRQNTHQNTGKPKADNYRILMSKLEPERLLKQTKESPKYWVPKIRSILLSTLFNLRNSLPLSVIAYNINVYIIEFTLLYQIIIKP